MYVKLYTEEQLIQILIKCCGEIYCDDGILKGKSPSELYEYISNEIIDSNKYITLFREDLTFDKSNLDINDISLYDFHGSKLSLKDIEKAEIICFIDSDKKTKILKTRY